MLQNYIKVSLRSLLGKKLFSAINITGLAVGLSACMLIALYVSNEYNFDRFHKNADRIFRMTAYVNENNKTGHQFGGSSSLMGPALKSEIPGIADYVRTVSNAVIVKTNSETFEEEALFADKNFLSVFSFPLLTGNAQDALEQINSVVLTKEMALKYFGSAEAAGKILYLKLKDEFEPFIVTGVTESIPGNSSIKFGMLLPISLDKQLTGNTQWLGFSVNTFCVLDKSADYKLLESKINSFYQRKVGAELAFVKKNAKVDLEVKLALQPMSQIHLNQEYVDNSNGIKNASKPVYSYMLMAIAAFILLIACINFVNLSMAGSLKRNKEIGIRKVIGGERIQIVVQFLGESVILCLIAFIFAFVLTCLSLQTFNKLVDRDFSISALFNIRLAVICFLLFLATGLIAGLYPAIVLSNFSPVKNFKNQQRVSSNSNFGKILIVVQFLFATFLIVGTVVIYSQYNFLSNKDLGYQDDNLIEIPLGHYYEKKVIELFRNEFINDPSVKKITGQLYKHQERIKIDGKEMDCETVNIDADYLTTFGIKLIEGRDLSADFPSDSLESVVVNETFLKEAGLTGRGIGEKFNYLWIKGNSKIVGVVKDYHFETIKEKIKPLILKVGTDRRYSSGKIFVKLEPGRGPSSIAAIGRLFKSVLPYLPFSYNYVEDLNNANYSKEENWKQIISISAGLAILVSCIGLLGLTVLATENRSKEVGIRKVLGSSSLQIVLLFIADFLKLVLIGIGLAMPVALWAQGKWLDDFAYKVDIAWWTFASCGAAVIFVSILPVIFQAFHASLKNPVEVLSTE